MQQISNDIINLNDEEILNRKLFNDFFDYLEKDKVLIKKREV